MAASLSGGAALVSILSYTHSAGIPVPGAAAIALLRAHNVRVSPTLDTAFAIGDSIQLATVVTDSSGNAMMGLSPAWTSGDPSIAQVSHAGTVTAQGPGSTAIVVRVGQLEARARIVVSQRPAALQVEDTLLRVRESERAPLIAHVVDARGNPIVGADVSWTTPDPTIATVEGADVVGVNPGRGSLTAMAGQLQLVLPLEVVPVPSSITVLGGEGQRGPAGRSLPVPVTAQVVSRTGRPMPGVAASFHSVAPGASAEPALDTSDARGMVRTIWRLGDVPGRQQLTISVDGVSVAPALGAEADPIPANTKVELITKEPTGEAGDTLRQPVVVRVTDSVGVALADVPVTWNALDGGALTALAPRTDSLGEARATWKLGSKAGRQRARAQVGNARSMPALSVVATANAGTGARVAVKAGDRQLGSVGTPLKQPLVLRSVDRHGNPVPGALVQLEPAAGRLADSSVITDSTGQASVQWTLGRHAGLQRLTIRLSGDSATTVATALARAGKAAKLAFVGAPETAKPGRQLPKPVVVEVTDAYGNALGGQTVVFKATSGSVTPARGLTGADGRANVRWTLGPKASKPELAASVAGSEVTRTLVISTRP
ncbi:MAG TPA: Ig-like domain-containing protein [Gemmatimonadales bacterium]